MKPDRALLLVAVAALVATLGVLGINRSRLTPGVHGDSVEYLSAAESFRADGTFTIPITHWSRSDSVAQLAHFPPGYPVVLSGMIRLGLSPQAAALWVTALAAAVVVGGTGLLMLSFGLLPAFLAAVAILSTPVFVRLHLAIWSEPVFMATTMLLLLSLVRRPRAHWLHGLLAGVGVAVRYVGLAGTLAAVLAGASRGRTHRERLVAMLQAGLPSLLFVLWWGRRVDASGEVIRDFGLQTGLERAAAQLLALMAEWPLPAGLVSSVWAGGASIVGGLALVLGAVLIREGARSPFWQDEPRRSVLRCTLLYVVCYLSVVVASRLFADPRIPFDTRIFFPVLVLGTAIAAAAAVEVAGRYDRAGWAVLWLVAGGWWLAGAAEVRRGVTSVNEYGLYFTSVGWAEDPVLRWVVERSAPYATVYSNEPAMIYFLTGRHAKSLPRLGEDLDAFARRLERAPGPVVFIAPSHVTDVAPQILVERLAVDRVVGSGAAALYLPTTSGPRP